MTNVSNNEQESGSERECLAVGLSLILILIAHIAGELIPFVDYPLIPVALGIVFTAVNYGVRR